MSRGLINWADGIFPLQDHDFQNHAEASEAVSRRQMMGGARLSKLEDPANGKDPGDCIPEIAREEDKGTVGDIHPWLFVQTKDRGIRGMGSWAQSFAAMTTGGGTGGSSGRYQRPIAPSEVHPLRDHESHEDRRYTKQLPGWPSCFPSLPQGVQVILAPGTEETKQEVLALHADPRLFSVHTEGPGEAGSLVCDLQPEAEPCMDGSSSPGLRGRHARLQSAVKVIPLGPRSLEKLRGAGFGNGLALNLALANVDKLAGYGMVWAQLDGSMAGPTTGGARVPVGPTTPGSSAGGGAPQMQAMPGSTNGATRGTGGGAPESAAPGPQSPTGGGAPAQGSTGTPGSGGEDDPRAPGDFGEFKPKPIAGHGVAFLAHLGAYGPFHAGSGTDKHKIGTDRDGHPINSGHIATGAYYYMDREKDAPLDFERQPYPRPQPMPLKSRVHLQYDAEQTHPWVEGSQEGLWRWWAEVPYVAPPTTRTPGDVVPPVGPRGPSTPGGPGIPGGPTTGGPGVPGSPVTPGGGGPGGGPGGPSTPGGPITPGSGGPESGAGGPESGGGTPGGRRPRQMPVLLSGTRNYVGGTVPEDVALYSILHPMQESFASWGFRPQLMVDGAESFTHNPLLPIEAYEDEDATRPMVLACDAWGAQAGPDWDYTRRPEQSRARGGTANGGILFRPPHLELEDYVGLGSESLTATATTGYVTVAPNVAFALGTPSTDGGLAEKSYRIRQNPSATDRGLLIEQLRGVTWVEIFAGRVQNSSGEVIAELALGGNQAIRIPRGTTAQRPSGIPTTGGEIRINTSTPGTDLLEFWDEQAGSWTQLGTPPIAPVAFIGDSGSGGTEGLVPAPAAGDAAAGKYLSADGTWSAPPGGSGLTQPQVMARTLGC